MTKEATNAYCTVDDDVIKARLSVPPTNDEYKQLAGVGSYYVVSNDALLWLMEARATLQQPIVTNDLVEVTARYELQDVRMVGENEIVLEALHGTVVEHPILISSFLEFHDLNEADPHLDLSIRRLTLV